MPTFTKLLVANRGEIAARVIRTARALGYETVAVYSTPDTDGLAVSLADEAVHIGPAPAAESYLNVEAILAAARRTGADAIHPGYGFLSENAAFAQACADANIVFVGPPPAAIEAMGDKALAKARMIAADVPTVPGYQAPEGDELSLEQAKSEAAAIGYPVLLKAVAGGGGRGMRRVDAPDQLEAAMASASREAQNAFGSGTLLLEKLVEGARHVEIQVFADAHGNALHLGERDCSAQRRHQKIIEESPCVVVDEGLRARMGAAAVAAAKAVDYVGAGTVEFLLTSEGAFYFLEMNTRLQVEHPVTELVTGLDLVEWQLEVAAGHELQLVQEQILLRGHAIEVRLYAEDPNAGFVPQTGEILAWRPADNQGLRVDHGLLVGRGRGQRIGSDYDPMVAKVIAYGDTREQARRRLLLGLRDTVLFGPTHNKRFLIDLLRHETFVAGEVTTAFVESEPGRSLVAPPSAPPAEAVALAAVIWLEALRDHAHPRPGVPVAWHSAHHSSSAIELRCGDQLTGLTLRPGPGAHDRPRWTVEQAGADAVEITLLADDGVRLRFVCDGRQRQAHYAWTAEHGLQLELDSHTYEFAEHRPHEGSSDPSSDGSDGRVRAPTMGRVLALWAELGQRVEPGARLLTLEAMKIESTITSPIAGTVTELRAAVGDQVDKAQVLVTITPEQPSEGTTDDR
ncbi:acetyl/propionyl/methylcrotonyl-CoA carboxylase subunit alpha [Enhygromyxa salina]|uniref:Acetyl-/propionyl-coenzyme A carboxylase alpha chain n=1 Tax=Enhygromyxa salina TaxID=215803 RepID=A0A2S9YXI4_9BACT|nr:biotin carboxylase N-terminal domain-containing protein [Enhygromyxa salina]PRQ09787.1 Acetyl-/propionyl-coenzyme A carboxylase alpha chain [Enhygromyxa salina]